MILSLDFDDTWTADPELWQMFCRQAKRRGHTVILVTNREPFPHYVREVHGAAAPWVDHIIFAGRRPKRDAAAEQGYDVDVWLDDYPSSVDFGR